MSWSEYHLWQRVTQLLEILLVYFYADFWVIASVMETVSFLSKVLDALYKLHRLPKRLRSCNVICSRRGYSEARSYIIVAIQIVLESFFYIV